MNSGVSFSKHLYPLPSNPNSLNFCNQNPDVSILPASSISYSEPITSQNLSDLIQRWKKLTEHAESSAKQISEVLKVRVGEDLEFAQCPFNPQHRMPPTALFRHYLICSSSPKILEADEILSSLRYNKTLEKHKDPSKPQSEFRALDDKDSDICISLEDENFRTFSSSFFYKDAPGVVSLGAKEDMNNVLIIPRVLASECFRDIDQDILLTFDTKLLPSESWTLKSEIAGWNDFPQKYSFVAVQVASGFSKLKESDILNWFLKNSPSFGVIVDASLARNVCVLLRLCLKAIFRESSLLYVKQREAGIRENPINPKDVVFNCPSLMESADWLASLLAILYGQLNGKKLALDLLKHVFISAGSAITYRIKHELVDSDNSSVNGMKDSSASDDANEQNGLKTGSHDRFLSEKVLISEIALAVSALHERFRLEDIIRRLRNSQAQPKYQLLAEYEQTVRNAAEVRQKRPNYKPLIEHDVLQSQRSSNTESKKHKTREEILAEERDYKRRRMSYRGRKVNRNPVQVLRDIIDAHMEEIKLVGGIGHVGNVAGLSQVGSQPSSRVSSHSGVSKTDRMFSISGDDFEARQPTEIEQGLESRDYELGYTYSRSHEHKKSLKNSQDKEGQSLSSDRCHFDDIYRENNDGQNFNTPTQSNHSTRFRGKHRHNESIPCSGLSLKIDDKARQKGNDHDRESDEYEHGYGYSKSHGLHKQKKSSNPFKRGRSPIEARYYSVDDWESDDHGGERHSQLGHDSRHKKQSKKNDGSHVSDSFFGNVDERHNGRNRHRKENVDHHHEHMQSKSHVGPTDVLRSSPFKREQSPSQDGYSSLDRSGRHAKHKTKKNSKSMDYDRWDP